MKRFLGFLSIMVLSLFLLTACGKNKVVAIQAEVPINEYEIGQVLDLNGAKLKVFYENGDQEVIDIEYAMVNTYDIINMYAYGTTGVKSFVVSYVDSEGTLFTTEFTVTIVEKQFKASAKADITNALSNVNNTTYSTDALAEIALRRQGAVAAINFADTQEEAQLVVQNFVTYLKTVKTLELEQGEAILDQQIKDSFADIKDLQASVDAMEAYSEEVEAIIALLGVDTDKTKLQALEDLKASIEAINAKITDIDERLGVLADIDIDVLKDAAAAVDAMKETVEGIATELTAVQSSVSTLEARVAALEALDLPAIKEKVDNMENTIASQIETALAGYVKSDQVESLLSNKLSSIKAEWISEIVEDVLGEIEVADVAFKVENGYIQWTVDGESWTNLIALSEISGATSVAKEIELRAEGDYIQWRYVGDDAWINLIALAAITGPAGETGPAGADGKKVELQASEDWIQWRYEGDTEWTNLIQVTTATALVSIEFEVVDGVLQFKQNEAEWVEIIDLNEFVNSLVDSKVENLEATLSSLDEKILELQEQFNGLSDYNDELAQEIISVKEYLASIGFDLDSTTDLSAMISSQVLTIIDELIEEYLSGRTGATNLTELVTFVKEQYGRIIEIKNALVAKVKDLYKVITSTDPLSDRVSQALQILLNNDDLYRLLNISEEMIEKINTSFSEFRSRIVTALKNKVASIFGLLVIPEYYSVTAFLEKFGSSIGEYVDEINNGVQYEKLEEVYLLVTEAQDLITTTEPSNLMANAVKIAEIYELIQRVDTIHEVVNAFFATKLEEAYQKIINPSEGLGDLIQNTHSIFMTKESYKNRILTTKSLQTGAELFKEAMAELDPFSQFINALKAIENINFENVRDNYDELNNQINLAKLYYNQMLDLFGETNTSNLLEHNDTLVPVKALIDFFANAETVDGVESFAGNVAQFGDLRYVLDAIEDYFAKMAALVNNAYQIEYSLVFDDAVNNPENPTSYNVREQKDLLAPTKAGYRFLGWYTQTTNGEIRLDKTPDFAPDGYYENPNVILSVYAKWSAEEYQLTLEATGDNYTWTEVLGFDYDTALTVNVTPVGAPAGYTFDYWAIDGVNVSEIDTWTWDEDKTAVAVWKANVYTITYVYYEGAEVDATFTIENEVVFPTAEDTDRRGYAFLGWYDNAEFTGESFTSYPVGTYNDKTVYAKWEAKVYNITYVLPSQPDGYTLPQNPATYTIEQSITLSLDAVLSGYTFMGWYLSLEGDNYTEAVTGWNAGDYVDDINIYGFFDESPQEITYVYYEGNVVTNNFTINTEVIFPVEPTREGYIFLGWYENPEFTGDSITSYPVGTLGNKTVYAKWEAKVYDITYVLNEGTNSENNPSTYTYGIGVASFTDPTRTGYAFIGWFDAEVDGNQVTSISTTQIDEVTLYARWDEHQYTIVFDYNRPFIEALASGRGKTYDANSIFGALTNISTFYSQDVTLPTAADTLYYLNTDPQNALHLQFAGWVYTDANNVQHLYEDGAVVSELTNTTDQAVLVAQWTEPTYTLTVPIGTSGVHAITRNIHYGDKIGFQASGLEEYITIIAPNRNTWPEGQQFVGYMLNSNESGTPEFVYPDTVLVWLYLENQSAQIVWDGFNYTIEYDTTELTNAQVATVIPSETAKYDADTTRLLSSITPETVDGRYAFVKWVYTDSEGTEYEFAPGDEFNIIPTEANQLFTLVAEWNINYYTINFDSVDGIGSMESIVHVLTGDLTLPESGYRLTGHHVAGWLVNGEATSEIALDAVITVDGKLAQPGETVTLVAKWAPDVYNITYDLQGGEEIANPATYTYGVGVESFATPSRVGHTFLGWFNYPIGGQEVTNISTTQLGNVVMYAQWEAKQYSIAYELDNGTQHIDNPTSYTYGVGVDSFYNPTRLGYTFNGWFTSAVGGEQVTSIAVDQLDDVTLFAQWIANTYTVVYTSGDISEGADITDERTFTYDQAQALLANGYTPIDEYSFYRFVGWKVVGDLTGTVYADEEEVMNLATSGTVTLVAQWDLVEYYFTLNMNDVEADVPTAPKTIMIKQGETFLQAFLRAYDAATIQELYTEGKIFYYGNGVVGYTIMNGSDEEVSLDIESVFDKNNYTIDNEGNVAATVKVLWGYRTFTLTLTSSIVEEGNVLFTTSSTTSVSHNSPLEYALPELTYEGYTFLGWFIQLPNGEVEITQGMKWEYEDEPVIGKWVKNA